MQHSNMYQVSHFTCQTFCFTTRQRQLLSARIKVFDTWGISPLLPHLSTFSQQNKGPNLGFGVQCVCCPSSLVSVLCLCNSTPETECDRGAEDPLRDSNLPGKVWACVLCT